MEVRSYYDGHAKMLPYFTVLPSRGLKDSDEEDARRLFASSQVQHAAEIQDAAGTMAKLQQEAATFEFEAVQAGKESSNLCGILDEAADVCISSEVAVYFVSCDVVARCQNYGASLRKWRPQDFVRRLRLRFPGSKPRHFTRRFVLCSKKLAFLQQRHVGLRACWFPVIQI